MLPKWHILIGFVFSYILVYFFNISLTAGIMIFLASFLIDIDHYFYYVYKKRNLNPLTARKYFAKLERFWKSRPKEKSKYKYPIIIFHGIEFVLFLIILSYFYHVFTFAIIGIILHLILDLIDCYFRKEPYYLKISQIYTFITNKNKKIFTKI